MRKIFDIIFVGRQWAQTINRDSECFYQTANYLAHEMVYITVL